jgi:hypothetical protein
MNRPKMTHTTNNVLSLFQQELAKQQQERGAKETPTKWLVM